MSLARVIQSDLSAGELSDDLRARVDAQAYFKGAKRLQNFLPRLTGGAEKRAAFEDVDAVIDADYPPLLMPFVFGRSIAYLLEFGHQVVRIRDRITGAFIESGGAPIELTTPYDAADLPGLIYAQSASVIYLAHADRNQPWKVIKRFAHDDWVIADFSFRDGPFLPENSTAVTLSFDAIAKGATANCTASSDTFTADMVGSRILVRPGVNSLDVDLWQPDKAYSLNKFTANDGRVYQMGAADTSGFYPPIHDEGTASDGEIDWTYIHDGYGVARITGFATATSVTVQIERHLPATASPLVTKFWALHAVSGAQGYPACVTLHEERLVAANTVTRPDTVDLSRSSDYDPDGAGFRRETAFGVVAADDAVSATIADGEVNEVTALVSADNLYVLTEGNVKRISGPSQDEPITPAGRVAREVTTIGARKRVRPVKAMDAVVYASADGRRLIELPTDGQRVRNLAFRARHALVSPIRQIVWAEMPDQRLFVLREDGGLWSVLYDRQENIVAFSPIVPGGSYAGRPPVIESVCVLPAEDGLDDLWIAIKRTVNGAETRRVERLRRIWDADTDRLDEQAYLDAGVLTDRWNGDAGKTMKFVPAMASETQPGDSGTLTAAGHTPFSAGDVGKEIWLRRTSRPSLETDMPGPLRLKITAFGSSTSVTAEMLSSAPAGLIDTDLSEWAVTGNVITGLDHLEGEAVHALRDGAADGPHTVASGQITLSANAARIWTGLAYTARLTSMPIDAGSDIGNGRSAMKHVEDVTLMLRQTLGGKIGREGGQAYEPVVVRQASDVLGRAPGPKTLDRTVRFGNSYSEQFSVDYIHDEPYAATVLGMAAKVTANG